MRSKKFFIFSNWIAIIFLMALFFSSCDDSICPGLYSNLMNVSFYDKQTRALKAIKVDTLTAVGTDTIFYAMDSANSFLLPVNMYDDSTVYLFINNGIADTLVVSYQRNLSMINRKCGYLEKFEKVNAPYSTFPEVISGNNTLTLSNDISIKIYF